MKLQLIDLNLYRDVKTGRIYSRDDLVCPTPEQEFIEHSTAAFLLSEMSPSQALRTLKEWKDETITHANKLYAGAAAIIRLHMHHYDHSKY